MTLTLYTPAGGMATKRKSKMKQKLVNGNLSFLTPLNKYFLPKIYKIKRKMAHFRKNVLYLVAIFKPGDEWGRISSSSTL